MNRMAVNKFESVKLSAEMTNSWLNFSRITSKGLSSVKSPIQQNQNVGPHIDLNWPFLRRIKRFIWSATSTQHPAGIGTKRPTQCQLFRRGPCSTGWHSSEQRLSSDWQGIFWLFFLLFFVIFNEAPRGASRLLKTSSSTDRGRQSSVV